MGPYLERYDELAALFPGEVDVTELALSQRAANLKVAELPSPLRLTSLLAAIGAQIIACQRLPNEGSARVLISSYARHAYVPNTAYLMNSGECVTLLDPYS